MTYKCTFFVYIDNRKPDAPIVGRQVSAQFRQVQALPKTYTVLGSNLTHTQATDLKRKHTKVPV